MEGLVFEFMASQDARLSKFEAYFKQQQSEMTNKIDIVLKAIIDRIAGMLPSDTVKNLKLEDDGEVMFIEIIRDDDKPQNEGPNEREKVTTKGPVVEYFDTFPTKDELTYYKSRYDHKKPEFELEESKMESNGSFRELIEQRFAAMVGYRKKKWGMS
ncbi:hypothetical protein Tco_0321544 [Tanacetum coccineum]